MNYLLTVLDNIVSSVWLQTPIFAVIAWIVFLVSQIRLKNTASEALRKRRRTVRTVSLILAILFTALLVLLFIYLSEEFQTPIP